MTADAGLIDEIVMLDRLVLRDHSAAAGDPLDLKAHRAKLEISIPKSRVVAVRREGKLTAYAYLWPQEGDHWFVGGLATHPAHRNASVLRELRRCVLDMVAANRIVTLESHVYRANRLSMAFHRKLGFETFRESEKGVAFRIETARLPGMGPASSVRASAAG